jgi:hypothetical protein
VISLIVLVPKLGKACVCRNDSEVQIKGRGQAAFINYCKEVCQREVFKRALIRAKAPGPSDHFTYLSSIFDFGLLQFHISYYRYFVTNSRISALSVTEIFLNLSKKDGM